MASTSDDELEYLSPGFDPATLTVARLRSIFVEHDVHYPSSAKKSDLVDLFNQKLAPRARKILSARSRIKRTSAGITDVPSSQEPSVNGENDEVPPLNENPIMNTGRTRKSRSARASTDDTLPEPTTAKKPSRRRTTKTPSSVAESEPVTSTEPVRPSARRNRRSAVPEVKEEEEETPRPPVNDESPFSNENPFQSGSSPLVQTELRRKSAARKSDRKSTSSRRTTDQEQAKIKEEPEEDESTARTSSTYALPANVLKTDTKEEESDGSLEAGEEFTAEEQQDLIQEGAARGEVDILNPRKKRPNRTKSTIKTAPVAILTTLLAVYAAWWRKEKIEVGYCGVGKPANTLTELQVPEPFLVLQPQCEPCPLHAYCYSDFEARCERDFVLRNHPLSLGGFIPLKPTCEPDGEKARKVKTVADRAVEELRERRAKFECGELTEEGGKLAKTAEISEPSLKAEVSSKRRRGMTDQEFEDLWKGAVGEITAREEVTSDMDGNTGAVLLSSSSLARIPFRCAVRRSVRTTLAKYRIYVGSALALFALLVYIRNYINNLRSDNARVPSLVTMTLDRVATQAALYAQGGSPEAFVSVGQMRDDVLREEFSSKRRDRLWKKVQAIVEHNANIRASVREGRSGEISRVWEWIGSLEAIEDSWLADRRRSGRYSFGPTGGTPDAGAINGRLGPAKGDGGDSGGQRKWDEGRPIY